PAMTRPISAAVGISNAWRSRRRAEELATIAQQSRRPALVRRETTLAGGEIQNSYRPPHPGLRDDRPDAPPSDGAPIHENPRAADAEVRRRIAAAVGNRVGDADTVECDLLDAVAECYAVLGVLNSDVSRPGIDHRAQRQRCVLRQGDINVCRRR